MKALQVSNIAKSYNGIPVLRDVSLDLDPGERVALMGPSGAGKSTLLNLIGGIDGYDSGEIEIGGQSLSQLNEEQRCELRRRSVSTVFQFFHLLPTLSAFENIEFPLQLNGIEESERVETVESLLKEVGVAHRSHAMPHELSGGEMQRIAIARALAVRPKLILADEPTGNLDSATGEAILDLLEEASERHSVAMLVVTHSPTVTRVCGRTMEMRDGQLSAA